jgi:protein gp37
MRRTPQHTYQLLTKRAERVARMAPRLPWPDNVWIGVSIESPKFAWRLDFLRRVPSAIRFVSAEPLLAALPNLNLKGIDWLIAGGESQAGCRPAEVAWFRDLRKQCLAADVAFFLKQLGGHPSKRAGDAAVLDGRRWTQMPQNYRAPTPSSIPSLAIADGLRSSGRSTLPSRCPRRSTVSRVGSP